MGTGAGWRKIIHLDLDAFFCAVEEQHRPELRRVPFAVGGLPANRGVVASCSYAARMFGIHSAMPMAHALRLCPHLIVVPPHRHLYARASRLVMARLRQITSLVEQLSIDEAFLDVSDLQTPGRQIAVELQNTIVQELRLPCSLGVATNKLVAKIATEVGKARAEGGKPPNAIIVVPPEEEAAFLAPLPVGMLWGVGPKTAERLGEFGVSTIGDLARMDRQILEREFGKWGHYLAERAQGIDDRSVVTSHQAKTLSHEVTFPQDVSDGNALQDALRRLSAQVVKRLKAKGMQASTVKIKVRWPDFTTLTRQTTLTTPTDEQDVVFEVANRLFHNLWKPGNPVRLLGVGVGGLTSGPRQLGLWDPEMKRNQRLQHALAELQARYGLAIIHRGVKQKE